MPYKTTVEELEQSNSVKFLIARTKTPLNDNVTGEQVEARWQPSHFNLLNSPSASPSPDGLWMVLRWDSLSSPVEFTVECQASGDLIVSGQASFSGGVSKSSKVVYCRTADSSFGA
jgi:hypothetical protein